MVTKITTGIKVQITSNKVELRSILVGLLEDKVVNPTNITIIEIHLNQTITKSCNKSRLLLVVVIKFWNAISFHNAIYP
jgi:hypothetical protein